MTGRAELSRLIREAELEEMHEALLAIAQPSIRLLAGEVAPDDSIPPGASKLGGAPDLPADFVWPVGPEGSLSFVAQINLQDARSQDPTALLPESGLLSFFYQDRFNSPAPVKLWTLWDWHVAFVDDDPAALQRLTPPGDLTEVHMVYKPCPLGFEPDITIPDPFSLPANQHLGLDYEALKEAGRDDLIDRYCSLTDSLLDSAPNGIIHRMLGYPDLIQSYILTEVEDFARNRTDLVEHYAPQLDADLEWILLLQIDSEYQADMMWGDVGRLYFFISAQDLAARHFDHVICTMQCS